MDVKIFTLLIITISLSNAVDNQLSLLTNHEYSKPIINCNIILK